MSVEDKFYAAVNVIRNLPKNGSYQPSHELMLRFYGYYKQATEGPNTTSRPNFWEVVKRAKWDAWARLGDMPSHNAMVAYVEELNKIVETMAYTDNVADFLSSLDSFYSRVPAQDLEMCIGPALDRVRGPGSRSSSPSERLGENENEDEKEEEGEDEEQEDFLDTLEEAEPEVRARLENDITEVTSAPVQNSPIHSNSPSVEMVLQKALSDVRSDILTINQRLQRMEDRFRHSGRERRRAAWGGLPGHTVGFLLLWPLFLNLLFFWLHRRRLRSS